MVHLPSQHKRSKMVPNSLKVRKWILCLGCFMTYAYKLANHGYKHFAPVIGGPNGDLSQGLQTLKEDFFLLYLCNNTCLCLVYRNITSA